MHLQRSPPCEQTEALWSAFALLTLLLALYITEEETIIRPLNTWHRSLCPALTQYRSAIRGWTLTLLRNMLLLIVTELVAVQYSTVQYKRRSRWVPTTKLPRTLTRQYLKLNHCLVDHNIRSKTLLVTYLFTYLLTYLLHGAESFLRSWPVLS